MSDLAIPVNVCAVCDAGKDPLTVPAKGCRHVTDEHHKTVLVPVVPKAVADRYREALEKITVIPEQSGGWARGDLAIAVDIARDALRPASSEERP